MNGRETKAPNSSDLLACFPSRGHLTLLPNSICSPGRAPDRTNRHHHHRRKKSSTTKCGSGQASPLLWGSETNAEPTSPKVTCAGQIKVIRPKSTTAASRRSWQSVMEEIEKIRNHDDHDNNNNKKKQNKKRPCWAHSSLSFKKEAMQALSCLQGMRFNLRCFGSSSEANIATEDEEDDGEDDEGYRENQPVKEEIDNETSRTVFSKWCMVLQENDQSNSVRKEDTVAATNDGTIAEAEEQTVPPPNNALLLMRSSSAPARNSSTEEPGRKGRENREEGRAKEKANSNERRRLKALLSEENRKKKKMKKEKLVVMRLDSEFCTVSSLSIAKEPWIAGGVRGQFSRSGSWNK